MKNHIEYIYLLNTDDRNVIELFAKRIEEARKSGKELILPDDVKIKRICKHCGHELK